MMPTSYYKEAREYLTSQGLEIVDCPSAASKEERKAIMAGCDAVIARTELYTEDMIDGAPDLKIIARAGVGFDKVPVEYCTQKGIWVSFTPQANYIPVAEHSLGLMIALSHNIARVDKAAKSGNWKIRDQVWGSEVYGKTLGIIGYGRIGREFAEMAHSALHMNIMGYDAFLKPEQFPEYCEVAGTIDEILRKADYVSIHVPSTPQTRHMVGLEFCRKMKPTAYIMNCARGDIVDEQGLYEALSQGVIAGAGVDVMENEPTLSSPLFELENFIVTPHTAALNKETIDRMGYHAAQCVVKVMNGERPIWPVNKL